MEAFLRQHDGKTDNLTMETTLDNRTFRNL